MQKVKEPQALKALIECALDQCVAITELPEKTLYQAARYSLLNGGKRLRPLLTLITASLYGASTESALIPACAVEMIHTYSLIHDDLPAMDNDDIRRGKPSLHKAFGEALAILAGDYLLTQAFEMVACAEEIPSYARIEMIKVLTHESSGRGMIGGQVLDLTLCGQSITIQQVEMTHQMKTGALISAAMTLGALVGNAPTEDLKLIRTAGYHLGLAFQIQDDLLDVFCEQHQRGKASGSDAEKGKMTAARVYGVKEAKQRINTLYEELTQMLEALSVNAAPLITFCQQIKNDVKQTAVL